VEGALAIIKGTASGQPLTGTLAANIIAGLGGNDQPFGNGESNLPPIGRAALDYLNDGEAEGRRGIGAVPPFNAFRPF
jgi:hypothetical protein